MMFDFTPTEEGAFIKINTKRFDATTVNQFKASVEERLPENSKAVSVDLSEVDFIDSSGIGALLSIHKRLTGDDPVKLLNAQPAVLSIIELLRLHKAFKLEQAGV